MTPIDNNRDSELPLGPIPDEEDECYDDSKDGEATAVDFQAVMDNALCQNDPLVNDGDAEDETIDETKGVVEEFEHEPSKTVQALKYLAEAGHPLSKLLDNVLLGEQNIHGNRQVMGARTELLKSSVISRILSRICQLPVGMCLRGKAHTAIKNEI